MAVMVITARQAPNLPREAMITGDRMAAAVQAAAGEGARTGQEATHLAQRTQVAWPRCADVLIIDPPHGYSRGIPASLRPAEGGRTRPGLTASPQAETASPAALMFFAALMSRSWILPHSGHVH